MSDRKKVRRRRASNKSASKKATKKKLSTRQKKSAAKKKTSKKLGRRFKFGAGVETEKHVVTLVMRKGSMAKYIKSRAAKNKSKKIKSKSGALYDGMSEELGFEVG